MNRRTVISGFMGTLLTSAVAVADNDSAANDNSYIDYGYQDYFDNNTLGTEACPSEDIQIAKRIVTAMPHDDPYLIMLRLKGLTERNSSGEPFNSRWKVYANPLIVFMFHEIHYHYASYPDDEVPWCAAALSWCLYWGGYLPPITPWSSQSFLQDDGFIKVQEKDLVRGDICVFTDTEDGSTGHVGFWSPDQQNVAAGSIRVLGANQFHQGRGAIPTLASQVCFEEITRNEKQSKNYSKYLSAFVRPKSKMESPTFSDDIRDFDLPCGGKSG